MDLREVLDDYVVTTVPGRRRAPSLCLVWSEAVPDDALPEEGGVLAILDYYRITRVPKAS
jgi:hypothetical protein